MAKRPKAITTEMLTKSVNAIYRFYGGRKVSPAGQLQILQHTLPLLGRILMLYNIDADILKDYQESLVPVYLSLQSEADIEKCFDATYVTIRRIRNKLHEV